MGKNHVILTGPWRTGKGLMVEILTKLGFDTGWTVEEARDRKLFLEYKLWGRDVNPDNLPYILKHPRMCMMLNSRVERYNWEVDHVYVFLRPLEECAKSFNYLKPEHSVKQARRLVLEMLGHLAYELGEGKFPHTFVQFPRYAQDYIYFRETMGYLLKDLPEDEIREVWEETVDPSLFVDYE